MKNVSKLATLVGLLALGAAAPNAFGLTTDQAYIASYSGRTDIPVPVRVVAPSADLSQAGVKVKVEFVVDTSGKPKNVTVVSATDRAFGESACEAVKQWRFAPARVHGTPTPMKVMLPIVVKAAD